MQPSIFSVDSRPKVVLNLESRHLDRDVLGKLRIYALIDHLDLDLDLDLILSIRVHTLV